MSESARSFGALVAHDGVTIVEYRAERAGLRVVGTWTDPGRSATIDEAVARLNTLINVHARKKATVSLALEQFGIVHHTMTLPPADDAVLRPVIQREVQRVFGVTNPIVAFTRGSMDERRNADRANAATAPRQVLIAAAPHETIDALRAGLSSADVGIATVVPKAMHALYEAAGAAIEPTAVLACLESGPHLGFFLDGRLELAIEPPIALEGDRPTPQMIIDQLERGAVYFRQQFRGASPSRVLLAARADEYETIAEGIQTRFGARVNPLFQGVASPEAVIAMGAVLEAQRAAPLDLYPHPPTLSQRASAVFRGENAMVAGFAAVAAAAAIWAGVQIGHLSAARHERDTLRSTIAASAPAVEPARQLAQQRSDLIKVVEFVNGSAAERSNLTTTIARISSAAPAAVRFDSLVVVRSASGWTMRIGGTAAAPSAAQVMRALDSFAEAARAAPMVTSAVLDNFDYAARDTSAAHVVKATFALTTDIARSGGPR